jgi:hypothetical protein
LAIQVKHVLSTKEARGGGGYFGFRIPETGKELEGNRGWRGYAKAKRLSLALQNIEIRISKSETMTECSRKKIRNGLRLIIPSFDNLRFVSNFALRISNFNRIVR